MKFTDEQLVSVVKESISIFGVLKALGISTGSGYTHRRIKDRIKMLGIDTSHFKGTRANSGDLHRGGSTPMSVAQTLVCRTVGFKRKTSVLKRALIAIGRKEECSCGLDAIWNGKPLTLQIDHINGNNIDDRAENLRFLCPNCHTQTPTYGSKSPKFKIMLR